MSRPAADATLCIRLLQSCTPQCLAAHVQLARAPALQDRCQAWRQGR